MAPSFSPEFRLAAACAMWPPSDRRTEAIHAAAGRPLDWPRFLRVARRHGVVGLVHDGLTRARLDMPPKIAQEIGAQAATMVHKNLAMAREALRLQRLSDDANLSVLFVKGASLAMLAYSNLGLRGGMDIDLLVPRETLPAATALLAGAGYRRFDPPLEVNDALLRLLLPLRKDLGFVHQATGLRIELHWRLFLNPYAMAEASLMSASRVVAPDCTPFRASTHSTPAKSIAYVTRPRTKCRRWVKLVFKEQGAIQEGLHYANLYMALKINFCALAEY